MNKRRFPVLRGFKSAAWRWLSAVLGLLGWLWTCDARAEAIAPAPDLAELPLEKLMEMEIPTVYGASKFEQKETEAPSIVTVIGSDEIKRYGYRTLGEVLESVQGLYVSDDRNYAFLGAGGINLGDFNSRVLVVVDGHRVNNDLTDGAYIDTAFILDVDLIDHVEVIQGPGSALYGDNAFFGVVNVVTRQGRQLNGAEVSGEYGGFDTYKGRVSYGKLFGNDVELLFSGTLYDSAGVDRLFYPQFNTPAQNHGVAENVDGGSFESGFGSLRWQDFTLSSAYIDRTKNNPTAQFFTAFNDPRLKTTDERGYVDIKYAHDFSQDIDLIARLFYDRADLDIGYPIPVPGGTTLFKETDHGQWWGTDVQLNKKLWEAHTFTAGGEYRDDFQQDRRILEQDTGQVFTDAHQNRQSYGVYGQADIAILTNLHVNAGVRYDRSGSFGPAFSPRTALLYSPLEGSTFKGIYGTAFRAPNFLELSDPRFQDIKPEKIDSYQLVYEQRIGRHLRSSIAGFYNQMHDLIVLESGSYTNFNANGQGIELGLEGTWAHGLRGRASYTLQRTENRTSSAELPDSPQHLFKFNLSVPIYEEKIFASLEFLYTGSRHTMYTTTTGETVPGVDAAGYGLVNLTLFSQALAKNLELSAGIYNLFNWRYGDPATRFHQQDIIEQNGRDFRVKLTYRF